ncbi:hypothetical protein [Chroococcidiopsis sp [FACHB-1243]]|nr:hypothetical protein [Chroococcidiopsis sp. [FACHB-1243]]
MSGEEGVGCGVNQDKGDKGDKGEKHAPLSCQLPITHYPLP